MKRIFPLFAALVMVFGSIILAEAALVSRLGGTVVYDTDLNLSWLSNANSGAGSPFDDGNFATDGAMSWLNAKAWTASLLINGVSGWRLPITEQPDFTCQANVPFEGTTISFGKHCARSEMAHLFDVEGVSVASQGLFNNIGISHPYWFGTVAPNAGSVFIYVSAAASQGTGVVPGQGLAWAVHDGDVSVVPIPSAFLLMGSGLVGLIGLSRRKRLMRG